MNMAMLRKVRFYSIDDLIAELKGKVNEIRLEALNETYLAALQIDAKTSHEPAFTFFVLTTAADDSIIYTFTKPVGKALAIDSEKVKQIASQVEKEREEIAKKLTDEGFTVMKGSYEQ